MNRTISVIRIAILLVLGCIAMMFLQGEEQDVNLDTFLFHVLVDKGIAFALIYYTGRLFLRWSKIDPWLKAYNRKCDEVMDKPNPLQL